MSDLIHSIVDTQLINLANKIESIAVKIIDRDNIIAWGRLRRAVKTNYIPSNFEIDVFIDESIAPYGQYVHEGRKPAMPPVGPIEEWARKKRLLSSSTKLPIRTSSQTKLSSKQQILANQYHNLAWSIAMKMKTHELKPRRFLLDAIITALKEHNNLL
ncbi:MAG: hypothetical protein PHW38_05840 [Candidatus Cloacimonetes bacterium]|jgi:hypothetical protein